MLEIHDFEALQAIALFTGDYLHPGEATSEFVQRRFAPR
jgi:hypothetical protein